MKTKQTKIKNLKKGMKVLFYGYAFEIVTDPYLCWTEEVASQFNSPAQFNGDVYGAKCKILKNCGDYLLDSFEKFQGNDLYTCSVIE